MWKTGKLSHSHTCIHWEQHVSLADWDITVCLALHCLATEQCTDKSAVTQLNVLTIEPSDADHLKEGQHHEREGRCIVVDESEEPNTSLVKEKKIVHKITN
jgi:hypothetical protein